MVEVFAPAKINLTLHITGQRDDGYHELDSLVTFATVGDRLTFDGLTRIANPSKPANLKVTGPEADGVPTDSSNLVCRVVDTLVNDVAVEAILDKHLPAAAGIGGGSADAAAAARAVFQAWGLADPDHVLRGPLASLGADIPMCVASQPLRAQGIGDRLSFHPLPPLYAVLVNPRVPVSTPQVFNALASKTNPPMPEALPDFDTAGALIAWLKTQRNDLEAPAIEIAPQIGEVLNRLATLENLGLARMSGSGATCFALFETEDDAKAAANELYHERPDWWVAGCVLHDMFLRALPR